MCGHEAAIRTGTPIVSETELRLPSQLQDPQICPSLRAQRDKYWAETYEAKASNQICREQAGQRRASMARSDVECGEARTMAELTPWPAATEAVRLDTCLEELL